MKKIYILPTQHFDLIWRKSDSYYREVRTRVIIKSLEIIKKYPEYHFFLDQAETIEEFMELNPEYTQELTTAIKSGRFEICGGGWTLADTNMVTGESIVRNLMYGRQWFKKTFEIDISVGSFVDTFGMCGQLPQIMKKFGDASCIPGRTPGGEGKYQYGNYGCFVWEGIDGSRVLSGVSALGQMSEDGMSGFDGYGVMEGFDELYQTMGSSLELANKNIGAGLYDLKKMPGEILFTEYTGEEHTPSAVLPELIHKYDERKACQYHISSPREFFESLNANDLPVIKGEFNPVFTGCFTTRIEIKREIRKAENALLSAESLLVLACVLTNATTAIDFSQAWRSLSYAEFHDAICGCHIDASYAGIISKINSTLKLASKQKMFAQKIADCLEAPEGSLFVFNTLGFSKEDLSVAQGMHGVDIFDEFGTTVPSYDDSEGTHFLASLPPMGYRCYSIVARKESNCAEKIQSDSFETGRYKVTVSSERLYIFDKLLDARIDTEEIPMGNIVYAQDSGNLWVERLTEKQVSENYGKIRLLSFEENAVYFSVTYDGVIDDLRDKKWDGAESLSWNKKYVFYKSMDKIDLKIRLNWSGKNSTVMIQYPCAFVSEQGKACYEVPFGSQKRQSYESCYQKNIGGSWPALNSADFSDHLCGLTVANDGTPSYRIENRMIQITMVRSGSDWSAPAFPFEPEQGSFDSGSHEYIASILPHKDDYFTSMSFRLGMQLNREAVAVAPKVCGKKNVPSFSFLNISEPNIILSACKPAESGDGYIVRLYEFQGKETTVCLRNPFGCKQAMEMDLPETVEKSIVSLSNLVFQPYEIKTLKLIL